MDVSLKHPAADMKVLVIGSGGREHALTWKLRQSAGVDEIFCAPGNAGTSREGRNVSIPVADMAGLARFARQNRIGLTITGPDDPLAAGIVDFFQSEGLRIFGPTKSAARIESSKIFAKQLMQAANIPTAKARTFTDSAEAVRSCSALDFPIVIKADGLALGKGVIIASEIDSAVSAIDSMMNQNQFGEAGRRIVIEEFLRGWECSLHALVDGTNYRLLAAARDHKRIFDGDKGPNTGGMGAVSPPSGWTAELESQFDREIMQPLLRALQERKIMFRGLLFPGLIVTPGGVRVLEFNCRFGDPETQAIMPRMKSDLLPLLEATIDGRIEKESIEWDDRASVTVVLASGGYPGKYATGKLITGVEEAAKIDGVQIFHAGTREEKGQLVTAGGRVLAVTALGWNVEAARAKAYQAASSIHFDGVHYRTDIGLGTSTG